MATIKELYLKNEKKLIVAVSMVLLLLAVTNLYFTLEVRVTSNDECLWVTKKVSKDSVEILFDYVKVDGVTWNAGIRNGDQFLKLNGQKLESPFQAQEILNNVKEGDYADYTVKQDGKILNTKVYVKKLIQIGSLANSMLAVIWLIIGFIVLMAKPDGLVQKLFYAIGASAVLGSAYILLPLNITPDMIRADIYYFLVVTTIYTIGISTLPFLMLSFFWVFPRRFGIMNKKWIRVLLYVLPAALFILSMAIFSTTINYVKGMPDYSHIAALRQYIGWLMLGVEIIALISLFINYRRLETKEEKKAVLLILIAFVVALAAIIYTSRVAPAISDTVFNSPAYYTPIILIILIPIAFAYSIFKYQLMDVSVVIKNAIMYGAATLAIAGTYFLVIYVLGQSISEAIGTQYQGALAAVIFILFAMVFQSTKDKFQDFLTARFYPEQFAYQKVLIRFGGEVTSMVGLENILDSMRKTLVESLGINHFGILIKGKSADIFTLVRKLGINSEKMEMSGRNLNDFIKEKSLMNPNVVVEQEDFPRVFPDCADMLVENEIFTVIPMIIKSKPVGLLLFGLKHSGSRFAGKDIELLYAAANQAAIAVENARLYQSEAEKLKMERDLELARKIQQGLLPRCIPELSGLDICGEMIPAMQVGGDYYDLIEISPTKLFVVVGDVSGKGLAASLYMTKLQTMIQLACTDGKTPKEILVDVNARIYQSLERNSFVTMTLALFDIEAHKVTFCRAGHMPVLIAQNGDVNSYRTQGLGIGLEKGKVFEQTLVEEELPIKSGQLYSFFSDGVTEAMNESMELFGEERLIKIIKGKTPKSSSEIMEDIWTQVNIFRGGFEQNDDMTMVLVKVK